MKMRNYSEEIDFVSIVIPAFNRYHYLEELVQSIHKNADLPFEIIIHCDNSNDGTREKILSELKDKVSSIILNNGLQLGLAESINRCVKIAGSNFIIMLNADCKIEYPCFRDIVNILKCQFVGSISLMSSVNDERATLINDVDGKDTNFQLLRGLGSGCAQAFRKDTFEEIGGWFSNNVASGNADVSFIIRMIKAGYFIASLSREISPVRNLSMDRERNKDSTISRGQYDCSYPKLFGLQKSKYLKLFNIHQSKYKFLDEKVGNEIYSILSRKRYESAANAMQVTYKEEGGDTNLHYWHTFMERMIKEDYTIDIEEAKKCGCGHDKWIDMIYEHKLIKRKRDHYG